MSTWSTGSSTSSTLPLKMVITATHKHSALSHTHTLQPDFTLPKLKVIAELSWCFQMMCEARWWLLAALSRHNYRRPLGIHIYWKRADAGCFMELPSGRCRVGEFLFKVKGVLCYNKVAASEGEKRASGLSKLQCLKLPLGVGFVATVYRDCIALNVQH